MVRVSAVLLALAVGLVAPALAADEWVELFDGKTFDGWTKSKENESTFTIKDGAIVANGPRCHLFYTGDVNGGIFENFELKVEVMTKPNSNGGIYFHTKYQEEGWPQKGFEVQVNNSFERDPRKTGSIYMVEDVHAKHANDNVWYVEHIIVKDNEVRVLVDGELVAWWRQPKDFREPNKLPAGSPFAPGRSLDEGTFALQGHDPGSTVMYRSIKVKPLP